MSHIAKIILPQRFEETEKDTLIQIRVEDYDWFTVTYVERESGYTTKMEMDWDDLLDYLGDITSLLPKDKYPYESFQLQIPGHPLIALSIHEAEDEDTFNTMTRCLERFVKQCCRNW